MEFGFRDAADRVVGEKKEDTGRTCSLPRKGRGPQGVVRFFVLCPLSFALCLLSLALLAPYFVFHFTGAD